MSPKLQPVRGTHDLLPEDFRKHAHVVNTARKLTENYGFDEVQTPIFEFSDVFSRTLGDTSDIVSKEMYTFEDRGGEKLTLRPELTAGLCRAFITHGLKDQVPLKWFYHGPLFRYERPQKGRQRQFHQIGVELLGAPEPEADVEIISMAYRLLVKLGLKDCVTLELNTLGDAESRARYRDALVAYFSQHEAQLSEDSRKRLQVNPLRILDSKDEGDRKLVANAPVNAEFFTEAAQAFYARVKAGLDSLGVPYRENPRIVRGLDYYNHTVFEFVTDQLGAQGTVLAGGRYDSLVSQMGGPDTAGTGWAAGVERLVGLLELRNEVIASRKTPVAVVPLSENVEQAAFILAQKLRDADVAVEMAYRGNAGKRFKKAVKAGAAQAVIVSEEALAKGELVLRDLTSGEQQEIAEAALLAKLQGA